MLIKLTDNKTGNSFRDVSHTFLTSSSEALSELSHFNSLLIHVWAKRRGMCGLRVCYMLQVLNQLSLRLTHKKSFEIQKCKRPAKKI